MYWNNDSCRKSRGIYRLTLTWDVLKCDDVADEDKQAED